MAFIFPSAVGRPAVVSDPKAVPLSFPFTLGNWLPSSITQCILQGITLSSSGNYQFLPTIGNFTYVYVFGELMGDITITGLAMAGNCPGNSSHGMGNAMDYYSEYAIGNTGIPILINMAGFAFSAFLVSGTWGYTDPKTRIGQFQYNFKAIL